jgi:hypothetical protein
MTCFLAIGFGFIVQAKETSLVVVNDGPKQEFSKIIYKEFNISQYGSVQLINKYGKIDARTWDGNQVKIKVTIIANTNGQAEAEKTFNRIRIDFYNDANFVKAETQIGQESGSWMSWSWNGSKNADFQINYEVYYPRGGFLDLSNRYGDSFVGYTNGAVKANIKYGNLRCEEINNKFDLNLQYGDAYASNVKKETNANIDYGKLIMKSTDKANLDGDYSEFEVENVNDVNIKSDYSTMRCGKIGNLTVDMDYGHLKVKEVGNINFKGDYTDIAINFLSNFASVDMDYGGLTVDKVGKNFSEFRVDANYTDIKVGTEDGCAYRLDAESNYGDINYPSGMNLTYEKDGNTSERIEGFLGSKNAKGLMKVNVSYGGIKIK